MNFGVIFLKEMASTQVVKSAMAPIIEKKKGVIGAISGLLKNKQEISFVVTSVETAIGVGFGH